MTELDDVTDAGRAITLCHMDLGLLFGSGAVSSLLTGLLMRWLQKRDRREDRAAAQLDTHRLELHRAYAAFVSAYSRFLDTGQILVGIDRAAREIQVEAWQRVMDEVHDEKAASEAATSAGADIVKKSRSVLDDCIAASSDANIKAVSLLLLEDDASYRKHIATLADSEIAWPQSESDYERFAGDLIRMRKELNTILALLSGAFSPMRWGINATQREMLPDANKRALPKGADELNPK